jgi:hypothetical protein
VLRDWFGTDTVSAVSGGIPRAAGLLGPAVSDLSNPTWLSP